MWRPTEPQIADALVHAERCAPLECCGVIAKNFYRPLENHATEHDSFVMDMRGYALLDRQFGIEAIVHSHVDCPPEPSEADRAMCEKLGLPWLIVSWPTGRHAVLSPSGWRGPLIGRQWAWNSQDCLALVRDALWANAGLSIPDFDRDWNFWKQGEDLIAWHFRGAGFIALPAGTPPKHCDVFGMQMPGSPVVNHLALFLAPDLILHQLMGQLSRRQVYDGFFQKATVLHLRHEVLA